jgi:hypothetical protein
MKLATAYDRGGKLYCHGYSETAAGVWILSEPVLTPTDDPETVGQAIRECLAASRGCVPDPPQSELDVLDKPLLTLAHARSFDDFAEGAKCVQIRMDGELLTLIPLRNGGRIDGFIALEEKTQTITPESDEELGSAILAALAMAE